MLALIAVVAMSEQDRVSFCLAARCLPRCCSSTFSISRGS